MMEDKYINLKKVIDTRNAMINYENQIYLEMVSNVNQKSAEIMKDDMGTSFVSNCARDFAGEVVRSCFNTSDFHISVDQMARRIIHFKYEDEYDPLGDNSEMRKSVYNYNDYDTSHFFNTLGESLNTDVFDRLGKSSTLRNIENTDANNRQKLFEKENGRYKDQTLIENGKRDYAESKTDAEGNIKDEYTGNDGEYVTDKNGNRKRREQVDHVQAANTLTYNSRYLKEEGVNELKALMNSADNFAMMDSAANQSKGDVRVYVDSKTGKVLKTNDVKSIKGDLKAEIKDKNPNLSNKEIADLADEEFKKKYDATAKASASQIAEATCERWENANNKEELAEKGYLVKNEDGTFSVPESVKKKLKDNIRHSQNAESMVLLKNADYKQIGKDSFTNMFTKTSADGKSSHFSVNSPFGKIVAGQLIYYTVPPFLYEVRQLLKNKKNDIDSLLDKLKESAKRIGRYVYSKLKNIFRGIAENSLKTLVKTFIDTIINMVKATVKKLLSIAKQLLMSTIDAVKVITTPNTSKLEKADAVTNLFAMTITNVVIELLFEMIENTAHIPEFLLKPFQMITSILCTNLVSLILQKADLFNVRFGFKINKIEEMLKEEMAIYNSKYNEAASYTDYQIDTMLREAEEQCKNTYSRLHKMSIYDEGVKDHLNVINNMFNMNLDFDKSFRKFLGIEDIEIA